MNQISVELIEDKEIGGFTARIPGVPAYGEGETEVSAISDLKEALHAYVEAFGIEDFNLLLQARKTARYIPVSLNDFALA